MPLKLCRKVVRSRSAGCSTEAHVSLEVSDTGVGIPEGLNIFEPFTTTKEAGTGLGLAIVQQIVAAHQGNHHLHQYPEPRDDLHHHSTYCCARTLNQTLVFVPLITARAATLF